MFSKSLNLCRLLSIALLLFLALPLQTLLSEEPPLRIGVVLPLTGPLAWVGTAMRRGIELAAESSRDQKIKLEFQDDLSSNRSAAVSAFRALTSASRVDGILNCSTSTLAAVAPVINQSETPTLILWDSNRDMPKFSQHVIGFGYANERAAEEAAEFLVKRQGAKRIALISFQNDWSELLKEAFSKRAQELGATLTISETAADSNTDMRSILLRAKHKQSDALYLPLYGLGLIAAIRQAREIRFNGSILTVDSLGELEMKETGAAANGVFVSQLFLPYNSLTAKSPLRSLGAKASSVDLGYTALGFDALSTLTQALRASKVAGNKLSATELMRGKEHHGELGLIRISSDGIADRSIPILEVKDLSFQPLS